MVPASDRARLEQLCRYLLRPPLGQDRVRLRPDGRVLVELKKAWRDGTSHLLFEPLEFLEELAAITPRPRVNLLLYHGVLAWAYSMPDPAHPSARPSRPPAHGPGRPRSRDRAVPRAASAPPRDARAVDGLP